MLCFIGLFVFRVLAQLLQTIHPIALLPPFENWHGAVMPYPMLVGIQVVVVFALAVILWKVKTDAISPSPWKHRTCFIIGGVYFSFMAFRLIAGWTVFSGHPWFSKSLPAFFHLVLASYFLLLGHYIYRRGKETKVPCDGV